MISHFSSGKFQGIKMRICILRFAYPAPKILIGAKKYRRRESSKDCPTSQESPVRERTGQSMQPLRFRIQSTSPTNQSNNKKKEENLNSVQSYKALRS